MAAIAIETASQEAIVKAMQSASPLLYGAALNPNSLQQYNADQLRKFKVPELQDMLEGDATVAPAQQGNAPGRFSQTPSKTIKANLVERSQGLFAGTISPAEVQGYESLAFLTGGAEININGTIDNEEELLALQEFVAELGKDDLDLSALYNNNVQTRVEEALDAQVRAEITSQVSAGLDYSNFLDEETLANLSPEERTSAIAAAYNNMLIEHRDDPNVNIYELQTRAFVDPDNGNWELSSQAGDILRDLNKGAIAPPQLSADIEANTPTTITRAQNYINLVNDEDIEVTGIRDNVTVEAAQAIIDKDINLADIEPAAIKAMAAQGQLALPTSEEDIKELLGDEGFENYSLRFAEADRGAGDYGMSKEQFLANELIVENPEKYETFLAEHNAANDTSLDQYLIKDTVETEVTNNPLDLPAQNTGLDALVNDTGIAADAIAQTPDGTAVFAGDQGMDNFVGYLKTELAAYDTTEISMYDALTAKYDASLTFRGDHIERTTAGTTMPTESEARFLDVLLKAQETGIPEGMTERDYIQSLISTEGVAGRMYDLENPEDVEKLLVGLSSYEQDKAGVLEINPDTQNYVAAYEADTRFTSDQDSIIRVANNNAIDDLSTQTTGTAVAEVAPAEPEVKPFVISEVSGPQSIIDPEVAAHYPQEPEQSIIERLENAKPAYASIIPTPSMFTSNPGIETTICLKDQFGACASPITSTPPAGMDIERPANINTINPDLAAEGLTLPNFADDKPRQSQPMPGLF